MSTLDLVLIFVGIPGALVWTYFGLRLWRRRWPAARERFHAAAIKMKAARAAQRDPGSQE